MAQRSILLTLFKYLLVVLIVLSFAYSLYYIVSIFNNINRLLEPCLNSTNTHFLDKCKRYSKYVNHWRIAIVVIAIIIALIVPISAIVGVVKQLFWALNALGMAMLILTTILFAYNLMIGPYTRPEIVLLNYIGIIFTVLLAAVAFVLVYLIQTQKGKTFNNSMNTLEETTNEIPMKAISTFLNQAPEQTHVKTSEEKPEIFNVTIENVVEKEIHIDDRKTFKNLRKKIDFNCLFLFEEIGKGNFGRVYKGILKSNFEKVEVAVKTSNSDDQLEIKLFLDEAILMQNFNHDNVLRLLGISFDAHNKPMIVTELMANGDLLSILRNRDNKLNGRLLMNFAIQIASGMDYLARNKYVHRDLAARNCLLSNEMVVKVADFGLARDIYDQDYYVSDNKKPLPIRWMSPESIVNGRYTTASDVWSFGVVVWELFTRGQRPYADIENEAVLDFISSNRRLPCPRHCLDEVYLIIIKCWSKDTSKRPTFSKLIIQLKEIAGQTHKTIVPNKLESKLYQNV